MKKQIRRKKTERNKDYIPVNSKTVHLLYPIETKIDGQPFTVTEIELKRLKLKHLSLLPDDFNANGGKIDPKFIAPIIQGMTGLDKSIVDEIDFEDLQNICDEMNSFL